jgi:hypothetical protein
MSIRMDEAVRVVAQFLPVASSSFLELVLFFVVCTGLPYGAT